MISANQPFKPLAKKARFGVTPKPTPGRVRYQSAIVAAN